MYALAAPPAAQPITGVIASTVPNMRSVRKASLRRGRSSTEPLPRAAANASADMLNARTTMANKLMTGGDRRAGTVRDQKPAGTVSGAYWSREAEFQSLPTVPRAKREYVDTDPPGMADATPQCSLVTISRAFCQRLTPGCNAGKIAASASRIATTQRVSGRWARLAPLAADPRIAGIAFTGSTETTPRNNLDLARRPGPIVPFIAKTGGQNATFVDSSALAEQVVADLLTSAFDSAGQRCSAPRLSYVRADIADRLLAIMAERGPQTRHRAPRGAVEEADHRHRPLLRAERAPRSAHRPAPASARSRRLIRSLR